MSENKQLFLPSFFPPVQSTQSFPPVQSTQSVPPVQFKYPHQTAWSWSQYHQRQTPHHQHQPVEELKMRPSLKNYVIYPTSATPLYARVATGLRNLVLSLRVNPNSQSFFNAFEEFSSLLSQPYVDPVLLQDAVNDFKEEYPHHVERFHAEWDRLNRFALTFTRFSNVA